MANADLEARLLDTFREKAMKGHAVHNFLEDFKKDPTNSKAIESYAAICDCPPERREGFLESLTRSSPAVVARAMARTGKRYDSHAVEFMDTNYDTLVASVDVQELQAMITGMSGTYGAIEAISRALKEGDSNTLRAVMAAKVYDGEEDWQNFVKKDAGEDQLRFLADYYVKGQTGYIMRKEGLLDLKEETGEDGKKKKVPVINEARARSYLLTQRSKLKDKQKPFAYLGASRALSELYQALAQQEQAQARAA